MGAPADRWIIGSVLLASACVLGAPLAGRAGFTLTADVLMALAAAGGLASFGLAAMQTLAHLRRSRAAHDSCGDGEREC